MYGVPPAEPYYAPPPAEPYYAPPPAEGTVYIEQPAESPYYGSQPEEATVSMFPTAETPYYSPPPEQAYPPPQYGGAPNYAPNAGYAPPPDSTQAPPKGAGGKSNLLKILIPVGVVVILLAAFACIYFFTDILPFGPNHIVTPSPSPVIDDPEPTPTPRPTPTPAPSGRGIPPGGGEVRINGESEITFTPDLSGRWEIRTISSGGTDPYISLYGPGGDLIDADDDGGGDYDAMIMAILDAGSEYTISVRFYDDDDSTCQLSVSYVGEGSGLYTSIPNSGGDVMVEGMTEFEFTPDKSGYWEFRTHGNGGSDPILLINDSDYNYIDSDDDSGGDGNALLNLNLDAGKTYSVIASFFGDEGSYMLSVTYIGDISNVLVPDDAISGDGGTYNVFSPTIYSFSPNTTGIWEIRTLDNGDCDPVLVMYDAEGNVVDEDDDNAENSNAVLTVYLVAGEPFMISAGFYGDVGSYKLRVTQCLQVPDEGGKMRVDGGAVFVFTPSKTGTWEFRTSNNGDSDPMMKIYDLTGNFIDSDDDGGGDKNALITAELSSDNLYILYMNLYGDDPTGAYDLTVTSK